MTASSNRTADGSDRSGEMAAAAQNPADILKAATPGGPTSREMIIDYVYFTLLRRDYGDLANALLINMGARANQWPKHQAILRHLAEEFEKSDCGVKYLNPVTDIFDPVTLDARPTFTLLLQRLFDKTCRNKFWNKMVVAASVTGRFASKAASLRRVDLVEALCNWCTCFITENAEEMIADMGGWDSFLHENSGVKTGIVRSSEELANTALITVLVGAALFMAYKIYKAPCSSCGD